MNSYNERLINLQETIYNSKNPTRRWLHNLRKTLVFDYISEVSLKSESKNCLEIGPGSGVYLNQLQSVCENVYASDIETAYLDDIKNKFENVITVQDDINSTVFSHDFFDIILFTEVIEHIPSEKQTIASIYNILKPGGYLILTTPQKYSPLELCSKIAYLPIIINIVRYIYKEEVLKAGHINLMTEQTLKKQLLDAGFEIIRSHKSGMYLPFIAELGGEGGLRLLKKIEQKIYKSKLDWLLWTQYYILRKP